MKDLSLWQMDLENKDAKKLSEIVWSYADKMAETLSQAKDKDQKYAAIFTYYRKYYTLTLSKAWVTAGINKSPTRDIILDYPWKDLKQDRFFCLKIWEKINK